MELKSIQHSEFEVVSGVKETRDYLKMHKFMERFYLNDFFKRWLSNQLCLRKGVLESVRAFNRKEEIEEFMNKLNINGRIRRKGFSILQNE